MNRRSPLQRLFGFLAAGIILGAVPAALRAQDATPPADPIPAVLFNTVVTDFEHSDYQGSLAAIDALIKLIPADLPPAQRSKVDALLEPIYYTRGAAYFNLNDYVQASTALKDYLGRYPRGARATEVSFSLAQADYLNKDYAAAAKGFAALEGAPVFRSQALLFEGMSYKELNEDAKATAYAAFVEDLRIAHASLDER